MGSFDKNGSQSLTSVSPLDQGCRWRLRARLSFQPRSPHRRSGQLPLLLPDQLPLLLPDQLPLLLHDQLPLLLPDQLPLLLPDTSSSHPHTALCYRRCRSSWMVWERSAPAGRRVCLVTRATHLLTASRVVQHHRLVPALPAALCRDNEAKADAAASPAAESA